jgi:hypothetical protein
MRIAAFSITNRSSFPTELPHARSMNDNYQRRVIPFIRSRKIVSAGQWTLTRAQPVLAP